MFPIGIGAGLAIAAGIKGAIGLGKTIAGGIQNRRNQKPDERKFQTSPFVQKYIDLYKSDKPLTEIPEYDLRRGEISQYSQDATTRAIRAADTPGAKQSAIFSGYKAELGALNNLALQNAMFGVQEEDRYKENLAGAYQFGAASDVQKEQFDLSQYSDELRNYYDNKRSAVSNIFSGISDIGGAAGGFIGGKINQQNFEKLLAAYQTTGGGGNTGGLPLPGAGGKYDDLFNNISGQLGVG